MTYPNSTDVSAGQPTAAAHYNNLRKDSIFLGQAAADSVNLGSFLAHFAANFKLQHLSTNRVRATHNAYHPAVIMIGGCMLKADANVDLPASQFTGEAALYYIHAVRAAGSTTFTLSVNTSIINSETSRPVGTCYWDGTNVTNIVSWFQNDGLPTAGYDSDWFSVAYNNTYTKEHHLGSNPRLILVFHSTDVFGAAEWVLVNIGYSASGISLVGATTSSIIIQTGSNATQGCLFSTRRVSAAGYYRILAWL